MFNNPNKTYKLTKQYQHISWFNNRPPSLFNKPSNEYDMTRRRELGE